MHIRATSSPDDLARVHADVLQPSFPSDELADLAVLQHLLAHGRLRLVVAEQHGALLGAAIAEWSPATGILLLAHLAVAPGGRGGGVGGALLDAAVEAWRAELDPWLVLAEVEDPAVHAGSPEHGDPVARLRFYRRRGARVVPVPYVQPAMRPGGPRVGGLLLLALCASGDRLAGVEADGTWLVPTAPLRAFLESYFASSEGVDPSGPDWDALVAALAPPVLRV
ncbi:GNAT family N-acetyltransferase [Cellulomonas sp. DKR-3]|uniref:GNAT family N-acetyltransferase n=1 Tax=Cellulomonas fulva TaxID=2835530 RepID=A0ABS5TXP3_9CELL|nr:GNAT family N-acetyltransferase [Cellulomonas fulva]MBT0993923.1 GNAT family N-acetyltransferase [Cellulomonas fulva]